MKNLIIAILSRAGFKVIRTKDFLNQNTHHLSLKNRVTVDQQKLELSGRSVFFGYHDKTPFSSDDSKILAHVVEGNGTFPASEAIKLKTGYFEKGSDGKFDNRFIEIGESNTWSWQQGSMLQWDPLAPNERVYYNCMVNGDHGALHVDIKKNEIIRTIPYPIYSIDPAGRYASSINFRRLGMIKPAYGYVNDPNKKPEESAPKEDGLWLIDLQDLKREKIVSLDDLAKFTGKNHYQFINHSTFSPDGKALVFFHVFENLTGDRSIRFYLYDVESSERTLLEAEDNVSHYCWRDENEIFTAENHLVHTGYYKYDLKNLSKTKVDLMNVGDVHPMFHPSNKNLLLADTRPDKKGFQHLLIYDLDQGKVDYLDRFFLPKEFEHDRRCDLHPRWSRSGKWISIDTAETGKRSMTILSF